MAETIDFPGQARGTVVEDDDEGLGADDLFVCGTLSS